MKNESCQGIRHQEVSAELKLLVERAASHKKSLIAIDKENAEARNERDFVAQSRLSEKQAGIFARLMECFYIAEEIFECPEDVFRTYMNAELRLQKAKVKRRDD